jgi:hypothetical protein
MRSEDDPELKEFLSNRITTFLSPSIQNEIIQDFGSVITTNLLTQLHNTLFSVILDGKQDYSKAEQLALCIRYCSIEKSSFLQPVEVFLGLYTPHNRRYQGRKSNEPIVRMSEGSWSG